jgi:hypothetical protein
LGSSINHVRCLRTYDLISYSVYHEAGAGGQSPPFPLGRRLGGGTESVWTLCLVLLGIEPGPLSVYLLSRPDFETEIYGTTFAVLYGFETWHRTLRDVEDRTPRRKFGPTGEGIDGSLKKCD